MKKKRYLPFGYRMIGGRIEIISEESDLVQNIFCSYLAGASLQQLAKLAEQTGLHFRENANAWNKNMISRILDDKRYWQKGLFPAIIQEELALQVSELKSSKASPKTPFHFLQKKICCFQCGKPLSRNSRSLPKIYWDCKDCGTKIGPIADNELLDATKEKFLSVCQSPQMTELESVSNNFLSMKVVRLTNEINQMLDQREIDPDRLLPLILECATEKYKACKVTESDHLTLKLKALFREHHSDEELDREFFEQTVKQVILQPDGSIQLRLINEKNNMKGEVLLWPER